MGAGFRRHRHDHGDLGSTAASQQGDSDARGKLPHAAGTERISLAGNPD